ncbi:Cellular nucleic acid-binding protein like protein [Trachymyrmex cornetzi]|uniref:Cellular nucleic acid-binding protein like protein n=1 Tax=Trachymyrmex cornetzi TaxID=471704 RepID=A0A151IUE9_9HYME|nr:Cellular nucleic acid-binding protein like protein [Trachymyrmex cornetzi]
MLPAEAESQFTKIIRTRIVGEARRTILDRNFNSVNELTQYLKQIYGPAKNVYQLQGKLGSIYQRNNEDVITYANRVKILGKQILETCRSPGTDIASPIIKASLEKDMCKCFIRGLKSEIEQRIARNLGVQETVADALRIVRELQEMTDLRQGQREGLDHKLCSSTNTLKENCQICHKEGHVATNCRKLTLNSQSKPDLGIEILICQICRKRGHGADRCRFRDPRSSRPINVLQANVEICQLCSKSGHIAKTCRSNNNVNFLANKGPVNCQWCDKSGHLASNCWKRQNAERGQDSKSKTICQVCNNFGHIAKDCRLKISRQQNIKDNIFCRYCKEPGHLIESCELRIASNNRRKNDNRGNSQGPSKSGVQQGSERALHPTTSQETK